MKIGIDISQVIYKTGVSQYTERLVSGLLAQNSGDEFVFLAGTLRQKKAFEHYLLSLSKFQNHVSKIVPWLPPTITDLLWNKLHVGSIERFIGSVDVFHSSDWAQPPGEAKMVTTVHDLSPILYPEYTSKKVAEVHKRRLFWVQKEVDLIIAPSQATKSDLIKLGFDPARIHVVYEAANYKKASEKQVEEIKKKYRITEDYALAVGVHPRKNTLRIIKAFENATAGKDMKLVLVGHPTLTMNKQLRNLRFTGKVDSDAEMDALYTGANVLIYPSLYEGFGIPILDAFVCETPVVTSNISSMVEVAGDAAVLVDPLSDESIAEGIRKALRSPKTYISQGIKRAAKFSWEKMVSETFTLYKSI